MPELAPYVNAQLRQLLGLAGRLSCSDRRWQDKGNVSIDPNLVKTAYPGPIGSIGLGR